MINNSLIFHLARNIQLYYYQYNDAMKILEKKLNNVIMYFDISEFPNVTKVIAKSLSIHLETKDLFIKYLECNV